MPNFAVISTETKIFSTFEFFFSYLRLTEFKISVKFTALTAYAGIAQLVEHDLAKVGVASSSLVSRSNLPEWWNR